MFLSCQLTPPSVVFLYRIMFNLGNDSSTPNGTSIIRHPVRRVAQKYNVCCLFSSLSQSPPNGAPAAASLRVRLAGRDVVVAVHVFFSVMSPFILAFCIRYPQGTTSTDRAGGTIRRAVLISIIIKIISRSFIVVVVVSVRAIRVRTRKRQWRYWGQRGPWKWAIRRKNRPDRVIGKCLDTMSSTKPGRRANP
jgi:hypothetical protein